MMREPVISTLRLTTLLTAAAVLGAGVAWLVAWLMGASPAAAGQAALSIAVAAPIGLAPALLKVGYDQWGLVVLVGGMLRGLIVLAVAFYVTRSPEVPARPVGLGAASGAVLILIIETIVAVNVLNRAFAAPAKSNASPANAQAQERPGTC